jgi:hypothetical protein
MTMVSVCVWLFQPRSLSECGKDKEIRRKQGNVEKENKKGSSHEVETDTTETQ